MLKIITHQGIISFCVLMLFVVESQLYANELKTEEIGENRSDHKVSFSIAYWNDNFDYRREFGGFFKMGRDDFVTTSFLFRTEFGNSFQEESIDLFLNILTNWAQEERTDLLTLGYFRSIPFWIGDLNLGGGYVANGNFGGASMQNWYHKQQGFYILDLRYPDSMGFGPFMTTGFKKEVTFDNWVTLDASVINSLKHNAVPSNFRTGISLDIHKAINEDSFLFQFRLITGYTRYYKIRYQLNPIFGKGVYTGLLFGFGFSDYLLISLWTTNNQYGNRQPQYGVIFTFKPKSKINDFFDSVLFP